jgi:hypothetical protein
MSKTNNLQEISRVMGGVSLKGGNQKVAKPTAITRLNMEDVCILWNVIEIF